MRGDCFFYLTVMVVDWGEIHFERISYNSCVWSIAHKHKFVGKLIIQIAAYSAPWIFNERFFPILKIMKTTGIMIVKETRNFSQRVKDARIDRAELQASVSSKEQIIAAKNSRALQNDLDEHEEGKM